MNQTAAIALAVSAALAVLASAAALWQGERAAQVASGTPPQAERKAADADAPQAPPAPDAMRPPEPARQRKPGSLSIAVWSLRPRAEPLVTQRSVTIPARPAPDRPATTDSEAAWRTTFGSERRDMKTRRRDASGLDADIIALQGVRHMHDVTRTFSSRDYFVVVSRQLLALASEGSEGSAATTAVLVRRSDGVRVTAQDHLFLRRLTGLSAPAAARSEAGPAIGSGEWADSDVNTGTRSPPPSPANEAETIAAAATAVRVLVDGAPLWVVSVDFSADCAEPVALLAGSACPAHQARLATIRAWIDSKRDDGFRAVFAGDGADHVAMTTASGGAAGIRLGSVADGCTSSDVSAALVRQPTAAKLEPAPAQLVARAGRDRCALLVAFDQ